MRGRHIMEFMYGTCLKFRYQAAKQGGFLSSIMGGLIFRKVNRATYPTKENRFSCHVNVEHMAVKANTLQGMLGDWEDMTLQRLTLNEQK
jgi:hypothetical protein